MKEVFLNKIYTLTSIVSCAAFSQKKKPHAQKNHAHVFNMFLFEAHNVCLRKADSIF